MTAPGLPFAPVLAQPLTRTVRPFHRETLRSYLDRLAAANLVPAHRLIAPSRWMTTSLDLCELLAVLTGRPIHTLQRAFPELNRHPPLALPHDTETKTMWACRRCSAQTGFPHPIRIRRAGRHRQICVDHGLWIGVGVVLPGDQLDLVHLPHVVKAQRRVNKLSRRWGRSTTIRAFENCDVFVRRLANHGGGLYITDHRLQRFARHEQWLLDRRNSPLKCAAVFPFVVEATAMLASPHWRSRILSPDKIDNRSFMKELHRRVPLGPPARKSREHGWVRQLAQSAQDVERTSRRTGEESRHGLTSAGDR